MTIFLSLSYAFKRIFTSKWTIRSYTIGKTFNFGRLIERCDMFEIYFYWRKLYELYIVHMYKYFIDWVYWKFSFGIFLNQHEPALHYKYRNEIGIFLKNFSFYVLQLKYTYIDGHWKLKMNEWMNWIECCVSSLFIQITISIMKRFHFGEISYGWN